MNKIIWVFIFILGELNRLLASEAMRFETNDRAPHARGFLLLTLPLRFTRPLIIHCLIQVWGQHGLFARFCFPR